MLGFKKRKKSTYLDSAITTAPDIFITFICCSFILTISKSNKLKVKLSYNREKFHVK